MEYVRKNTNAHNKRRKNKWTKEKKERESSEKKSSLREKKERESSEKKNLARKKKKTEDYRKNNHYRESVDKNSTIQLEPVNIPKDNSKIDESQESRLQWHPAFYAEIQIELDAEAFNLIFENEHQLGTRPKEIDVLIIKKDKTISVQKNIGRIFREHNIIEYKSPEDSLGVNDFYRVLGYTYFYKADTKEENSLRIEDITVTFVASRYPRALIRHLKQQGDWLEEQEPGIYYIEGEKIPIQLIVTSRLSDTENFWLKNLTNDIRNETTVDKILREYEKHKDNNYYKSVMDIIVKANEKMFKGGHDMCDALWELFGDQLEARMKKEIEKQVEERVKEQVEKRVEERVKEQVEKRVEERVKEQVEKRVEGRMKKLRMIIRMDARGIDWQTIAQECAVSLDEVEKVLVD